RLRTPTGAWPGPRGGASPPDLGQTIAQAGGEDAASRSRIEGERRHLVSEIPGLHASLGSNVPQIKARALRQCEHGAIGRDRDTCVCAERADLKVLAVRSLQRVKVKQRGAYGEHHPAEIGSRERGQT